MHPNESPLKILEKGERGRIQGLLVFLGTPIISRTVKLQTSNFVCTFTRSIGLSEQKSIKNVGKSSRGHSQGLPKIFRAAIYIGRIFAIAQFLPRDASAERGYEIAFVCLSVCDV